MWLIASLFILLITAVLLAALLMKTRNFLGRHTLAWRGAFRIALLATAMNYAADYPINALLGTFPGAVIGALVLYAMVWTLGLTRMIDAPPKRAVPIAMTASVVTVLLQQALLLITPNG